jgi:hypothetical protein
MMYGREFEPPRTRRRRSWASRLGRPPRRPARGYPVRGLHTYDLDYGRQAGGPDTDYSGRAGWPTGVREEPSMPSERGAWYRRAGYEGGRPRDARWFPAGGESHWAAAERFRYIRHRRKRGRRHRWR